MAAFEIRGHKPEWGILDHYLLLLGEPSMGLAPILVNQIFNITRDINQQGISILLWE
jgi:branched-chain amino acid transport system ATP-binding protein